MKEHHSRIGEYGFRLIPVEESKNKKGKKIAPHWKKIKFNWKHT